MCRSRLCDIENLRTEDHEIIKIYCKPFYLLIRTKDLFLM